MRSSSNPVFSSLSQDSARGATQLGGAGRATFQQGQYGQQGFGAQAGYGAPQAHPQFEADTRPMTIDDVVTKTAMTLGLLSIVGVIAFYMISVNPGLLFPLLLVGGIGGLVVVLIATFGRKMDSAPITLTYGALEGLFVGAATYLFTADIQGGGVLGAVGAAILGTIGVFVGMLFVYKTGAVRVTPKFTRFLTAAIVGVLFAALGSILLSFFTGGSNPLYNGGPIAIAFCLLCIGLAAFSFLLDFDNADRLVRAGAPNKMAWGVALGLTVTLVWLYIEILRLMSYFRD
ncbi:membrane protein [Dietzia sp. UCD-THP]|uniref:Bax inhibitor-1/YccA family protein n=1 Tax=Dietzia sp. UCD-THP TaxID=1292020 RepID=UPI00035D1D8F|nr:Bax inhibitor-1/YccA family protein [Dietzia sp. UCD-THP]EYT62965.1 membrane protein [Dietzia sp. UCD-THP]